MAALLALTLALAAALRFWALEQGLPDPAARPDEREVLQFTAAFAAGDFNPRWFVRAGRSAAGRSECRSAPAARA